MKQQKQNKKRNRLFRYIRIVLVYRLVKWLKSLNRFYFPKVICLYINVDAPESSLERVSRHIEELRKKGYRVRLRKL